MVDKNLQSFNEFSQPESSGVLTFEASSYMEYADDLELTEAQKIEFLQTLWNIMAAFVNAGFAVDSVIPALMQKASMCDENALQQSLPTHEFNVAADDEENGKV
jgi:hypothetical protein